VGKIAKHDIRAFRPWLYTLAKNHCLMRLRKVGQKFTVPFDPGFMYSLEIPHLGEDVEDQEQQLQRMENCLQQLPDLQQLCIRRFYYDDKSYKEIAEMEQMDLGTIRSYIQNGRRNLKNCMNG
jgi:RNA polymerase sigma-70 factor (ECF subfamily)